MNRAAVLAEARSWLGTRWQHQARSKGVGCDCIGFVAGVALAVGLDDAARFFRDMDTEGYGREPNSTMLLRVCFRYLDPIALSDAVPGDILLMRFKSEPQHFGLLSQRDPDYMLHAYAQARKVAENRIDAVWKSRIVGAWKFRGLDG